MLYKSQILYFSPGFHHMEFDSQACNDFSLLDYVMIIENCLMNVTIISGLQLSNWNTGTFPVTSSLLRYHLQHPFIYVHRRTIPSHPSHNDRRFVPSLPMMIYTTEIVINFTRILTVPVNRH